VSDLYTSLYSTIVEKLQSLERFHGSHVRDLFIDHANGRFFVDNHAEQLLKELVEAGRLKILERAPTMSQAAFTGLHHTQKSYRDTPWGPGTREHYFYTWIKHE